MYLDVVFVFVGWFGVLYYVVEYCYYVGCGFFEVGGVCGVDGGLYVGEVEGVECCWGCVGCGGFLGLFEDCEE